MKMRGCEQEMERLMKFVPKEEKETFQTCIEGIVERVQDYAFMDGYEYAIKVLQESKVRDKGIKF